jgi:uncharacterized protein (DUF2235 family)
MSQIRVPDLEPFHPPPQRSPNGVKLGAPHVRSRWRRIVDSSAEIHTNEAALRDALASHRPKRIVICADGTWNVPKEVQPGGDAPTNVWLLYQLVKDVDADGTPQLKYYHAGVGTKRTWLRRVTDGATGRGLSDNMRDAYAFLVDHYNPGDHVYLFGFSRGAYTVRTLAGMIRNSGIVDRAKYAGRAQEMEKAMEAAYELYRLRTDDTAPAAPRAREFRAAHSHPDFYISCIGVWDTVGSLGVPVESKLTSPLQWFNERVAGFHDVTLSGYVDCAFHALAIDERRGPFKPTLWNQKADARAAGQILEQVWFAGVHSDVGGGYPWNERGLANVTLRWMLNRVAATCKLDSDPYPIEDLEQQTPTTVALHDSMEWYYKVLDATRLSSCADRVLGQGSVAAETAESLHRSVDVCLETYKAADFPLVNRPYAPPNVGEFERRTGERRRNPNGPVPGADRRSGVDRRAARDRRAGQ